MQKNILAIFIILLSLNLLNYAGDFSKAAQFHDDLKIFRPCSEIISKIDDFIRNNKEYTYVYWKNHHGIRHENDSYGATVIFSTDDVDADDCRAIEKKWFD